MTAQSEPVQPEKRLDLPPEVLTTLRAKLDEKIALRKRAGDYNVDSADIRFILEVLREII